MMSACIGGFEAGKASSLAWKRLTFAEYLYILLVVKTTLLNLMVHQQKVGLPENTVG